MTWVIWAVNLLLQTFTSTTASRARNSGSLKRHIIASVGSHGVWILQLQMLLGPLMAYMNGSAGLLMQVVAGLFYTTFAVVGGVLAHHWALRTEKGKSAVGASTKYAQIPVEEWDQVKNAVARQCELFQNTLGAVSIPVGDQTLSFKQGLLSRSNSLIDEVYKKEGQIRR
jgi:hypothetical protein